MPRERFGDFVLDIPVENLPKTGFWLFNSPHQTEFASAMLKYFTVPLPTELRLWWSFTYRFYLAYYFFGFLNDETEFERLGLKEIRDLLKSQKEKNYCFEHEVWNMMFHQDDVNPDLMERMLKQTLDWINLFE